MDLFSSVSCVTYVSWDSTCHPFYALAADLWFYAALGLGSLPALCGAFVTAFTFAHIRTTTLKRFFPTFPAHGGLTFPYPYPHHRTLYTLAWRKTSVEKDKRHGNFYLPTVPSTYLPFPFSHLPLFPNPDTNHVHYLNRFFLPSTYALPFQACCSTYLLYLLPYSIYFPSIHLPHCPSYYPFICSHLPVPHSISAVWFVVDIVGFFWTSGGRVALPFFHSHGLVLLLWRMALIRIFPLRPSIGGGTVWRRMALGGRTAARPALYISTPLMLYMQQHTAWNRRLPSYLFSLSVWTYLPTHQFLYCGLLLCVKTLAAHNAFARIFVG